MRTYSLHVAASVVVIICASLITVIKCHVPSTLYPITIQARDAYTLVTGGNNSEGEVSYNQ